MKRFTLLALTAALLALPTGASSQEYNGIPDAQEYLNFLGGSGVGAYGVQVGPYVGNFQGDPGTAQFSIYCVDFQHYAQSQRVNVTAVSPAVDLSNTRAESYVKYQRAAYLSSLFDSYGTSQWGAIHAAIWYEMSNGSVMLGSGYGDFVTLAADNAASFDTNGWYVLSPLTADGPAYDGTGQEFLMRTASVPEPTTFLLLATGLVLLAAFSRRRFATDDDL